MILPYICKAQLWDKSELNVYRIGHQRRAFIGTVWRRRLSVMCLE